MKNPISLAVCLFLVVVFSAVRWQKADFQSKTATNTLTWDVLGYYMYLPGQFIYHDLGRLEWWPKIQETYQPTGQFYQASKLPNGQFVMKYPIGMAQLFAPFFFVGHWVAGRLGFPQDGFSMPYQLAICAGVLLFSLLGLLILRRVLSRFFPDSTVAITLLLIGLATNYPQYVAIDSGMTHGFLFTLYAAMLLFTLKWHEKPARGLAFGIGLVLGLAVVARPTEAVMLFIPWLWATQNRSAWREKWSLVRQNRSHFGWAFLGGLLAVAPQLIYWKIYTGGWLYDVGSKFTFFRPNWQVLFGFGNGWLIYTPLVFLMIWGLFFSKKWPFRRTAWWFFIVNTWIIIAWSDPKFGGTFSGRAFVQGYAVLALPLGEVVKSWLENRLGRWLGLLLGSFLVFLNCFQWWQFQHGIIHHRDMNGPYFRAVFLNTEPSPLDCSLLDFAERLPESHPFLTENELVSMDSTRQIHGSQNPKTIFLNEKWATATANFQPEKENWLLVSAEIRSEWGAFDSFLTARFSDGDFSKKTAVRLQNGLSPVAGGEWGPVAFQFKIPAGYANGRLEIFAETGSTQRIELRNLRVERLQE